MDIDFAAALSNLIEELAGNLITVFRNDLHGRFDAELRVDVEQSRREIPASHRLDVMSDDGAGLVAPRPEPDERNSRLARRFYGKRQEALQHKICRAIHRPGWKGEIVPSF